MADQRFLATEEVVGALHGTKADTINRLALVEHNNDGTHNITRGSASLATFTITAANGTYQDSGLFVDLPAAGTYEISYNVSGLVVTATNPPGYLLAKLFNATDAVDVASSVSSFALAQVNAANGVGSTAWSGLVTVTAAKRIRLYVARMGGATTWTSSYVATDANGTTSLSYKRIG